MAVDAQVALSWLMTDPCKIKTKNQFVKNRLKDIKVMVKEIKDEFNLNILFKYINTKDNPADLLTRGVTRDARCPNKAGNSGFLIIAKNGRPGFLYSSHQEL